MKTLEEKHKEIIKFVCNNWHIQLCNLHIVINYLEINNILLTNEAKKLYKLWCNYRFNGNMNSLNLLIALLYKKISNCKLIK